MEFSIKTGPLEKQRTHCIMVGVLETRKLSPSAATLDEVSGGYLSAVLKKGDLEGKLGQTLVLHQVPNLQAERVLLVGCGPKPELNDPDYREIISKSLSSLSQTGASEATNCLTELSVKDRDLSWKIRQAVELSLEASYTFDDFKSKKEKEKEKSGLKRHILWVPSKREFRASERAVQEGEAIGAGVAFAKDLGNMPPNLCTPGYLAKEAESLGKQYSKISVAVLDEKEIQALKMGALLSVAKGSKHSPKFITLEYRGSRDKQKPIVLVGKGITFDTGGNSLKPGPAMVSMKYDMAGGAAVLGTLKTIAELELPLHVIGLIPTAENMPGSSASRPEDIVTTMSGQTVEILNTDAEGRLILCDALTYTERFNPDVVIDVATLTAACATALGRFASGLFSNHQPLADALLAAGQESGDRCWQLPLWQDYQPYLSSPFADMANISNIAEAGAITAACYLARFTEKYHWAHLDIAGVACKSPGKERMGTGRPVPLLVQYLLNCSHG